MLYVPLLALGALLASMISAGAAAERPRFQLSGSCGQDWRATTYQTHAPDPDSLDLTVRDAALSNVGRGWPVLAMASGEITKADIFQTEDKGPLYRINVDHGGGWKTIYLHSGLDDFDLLRVGRRVMQGEMLAWTSNSGAKAVHQHVTQLQDGAAVRQVFAGRAVATHQGDQSSWGLWDTPEKAEVIVSANCPGNRFMSWVQSGESYAMLYRPSDGRTQIKRLNPDGSTTNTWTGNLGRGWTHFESYTLGAHAHAIFYKAATGEVRFVRMNLQGDGITNRGSGTWFAGWSHIMPFGRAGRTYLLVYSSLHGFANLERVKPDGTGTINLKKRVWEKGRTSLVFYQAGPNQYVLFYKGGNGRARIAKINGSDDDLRFDQVWTRDRRNNWTTLVAFPQSGRNYLFGYQAETGEARIWELDRNGQGFRMTAELKMQLDWTALTPWSTSQGPRLLAYKLLNGRVRSFSFDDNGGGLTKLRSGTWLAGWQ